MEKSYAQVCTQTHKVINMVVWDGVTEYKLEGCTLVEVPEGVTVDIGYSYENDVFSPPLEG